MKAIEISDIGAVLEKYDKDEQPLILTRNGQPVAALFPLQDTDLETLSLSINPKFLNILEQSRKSQKQEGRVFLEDIHLPLEP